MRKNAILHPFLFSFLAIVTIQLKGQSQSDYIDTDSSRMNGQVIPLGGNQIRFIKYRGAVPVEYGIDQLSGYGHQGKVYERLSIDGTKHFARKLVSDSVRLYRFRRHYFLGIGAELVKLRRATFRDVIRERVRFSGSSERLAKLTFSDGPLISFIQATNKGGCDLGAFRYRTLGIFGGYQVLTFDALPISQFDKILGAPSQQAHVYGTDAVAAVGLIHDFSLRKLHRTALTTEMQYLQSALKNFSPGNSPFSPFDSKLEGLIAMVGMRREFIDTNPVPYARTGVSATWIKVRSTLHSNAITHSIAQEANDRSSVLPGAFVGLGIRTLPKKRSSAFLEVRQQSTFLGNFYSYKMRMDATSVVAGIFF